MPHIDLPEGIPGIRSGFAFRPETARPLCDLAEVLLRDENTLSRGERELIAAYVSNLNECAFCQASHSAFAAVQLEGGMNLVEEVKRDPASAPISPSCVRCSRSPPRSRSTGVPSPPTTWPPPAVRAQPTSRSMTRC